MESLKENWNVICDESANQSQCAGWYKSSIYADGSNSFVPVWLRRFPTTTSLSTSTVSLMTTCLTRSILSFSNPSELPRYLCVSSPPSPPSLSTPRYQTAQSSPSSVSATRPVQSQLPLRRLVPRERVLRLPQRQWTHPESRRALIFFPAPYDRHAGAQRA